MAHLEVWVVSGLMVALGAAEAAAGRLLKRSRRDEIVVDVLSLAQFALLIKPAIVAASALLIGMLAPPGGWQLPAWPLAVKVTLFVLTADLMHYGYHRLGHTVPLLWRMHRTHHTATAMSISISYRENWRWFVFMPDLWLAGALVHLGWGQAVLVGHLIFGCANVLVHSGFAWDGWLYRHRALAPLAWLLERLVQLPSTHRAHHAMQGPDGRPPHCNFAQLLFIWDTLLGTAVFPRSQQPQRYGIPHDPGDPWYAQLWFPLLRSPRQDSDYR